MKKTMNTKNLKPEQIEIIENLLTTYQCAFYEYGEDEVTVKFNNEEYLIDTGDYQYVNVILDGVINKW